MFLGICVRISHAKNQLPTTLNVACRAATDKQTNTHAERDIFFAQWPKIQRRSKLTYGPFVHEASQKTTRIWCVQ